MVSSNFFIWMSFSIGKSRGCVLKQLSRLSGLNEKFSFAKRVSLRWRRTWTSGLAHLACELPDEPKTSANPYSNIESLRFLGTRKPHRT